MEKIMIVCKAYLGDNYDTGIDDRMAIRIDSIKSIDLEHKIDKCFEEIVRVIGCTFVYVDKCLYIDMNWKINPDLEAYYLRNKNEIEKYLNK
jgi:hypothetical protein